MLSVPARLALTGLVLSLATVVVSPAQAGCVTASRPALAADLTVELARGVTGQRCDAAGRELYAPTGETIDLTLEVLASRLAR